MLLTLQEGGNAFTTPLGCTTGRELPFQGKKRERNLAIPFARGFESKLNHYLLCIISF